MRPTKYKKEIDKIAVPENYYFRGPVEWMIRTYSKFMYLPATYSTLGSHYTARQLNERPRKTLHYQTPAEKFEACVAATR